MKLLHTADWHIGQLFHDHDRKWEHTQFFEWLGKQISLHKVDVLLVAGDIFDTSNPSAQALTIYYHFLRDITLENPNLQIVIIAGNHDSAARLEAPNPLLESMNVTVRGVVKRTQEGEIDFNHLIVPLDKGGYVITIPYLRQGDYPESPNYAQGVETMVQKLYEQAATLQPVPIIAMGHLLANGAELSLNDRAERAIIGGLECISPGAFSKGISYTALGHLHRAQRVAGRENVRYAGAPLPMSFAEKNNNQGVVLITIEQTTNIEFLPFEPPVKLLSIPKEPKPLPFVLDEIEKLSNGVITQTSPYVEVKVHITEPEPSLRSQIEKALEGKSVRLTRIERFMEQSEEKKYVSNFQELQKMDIMSMATDIFIRRYGGSEIPQGMKELLQTVIRGVSIANKEDAS